MTISLRFVIQTSIRQQPHEDVRDTKLFSPTGIRMRGALARARLGKYAIACSVIAAPTILVFDSGLGGLTVFREAAKARPDARFVYAADDAFFPYARHPEDVLVERVL